MTEERIKELKKAILLELIVSKDMVADVLERYIRTVATEAREEGIEEAFGGPGKIVTVDPLTWRAFEGSGIPPRYCLRIEVEYDCMVDRDLAERIIEERLEENGK